MKNRKAMPFLLIAFALLISTPAFAGEAPASPASEAEFLESLQAPATPESSPSLNPSVGQGPRNPTPIFQHGWDCTYIGSRDCVPCSVGKRMHCDDYRCNYNGTWHTDSICGSCNNFC